LLEHVQKGCCCDPFPVDEINVAVDPDADYPDYMRLGSTSQGESTNQVINRMTNDIGSQSAQTADKRLWLRFTRLNLAKDLKIRKITKTKQPRDMEWYIHEALLRDMLDLSMYKHIEFPPEIQDDYFEPIGIEYGRYKEWEKVQASIDRLSQLTLLEENAAIEDGPTVMDVDDFALTPPTPTPVSVPPTPTPTNTTTGMLPSTVPSQYPPKPAHMPVDLYSTQAKWGRCLGPMSAYTVSILNTYLPQNKALMYGQRKAFWDTVIEAKSMNGGASADKIVSTIIEIWNNKHFLSIQGGASFGLGGMMRAGHAKSLLQQQAYTLKAIQMRGLHPSKPSPSFTQKTIRKRDIEAPSYRDAAGAVLKNLNMRMHKTLKERKDALGKLFEGQHAEYGLI
jgi:hypothetical protein